MYVFILRNLGPDNFHHDADFDFLPIGPPLIAMSPLNFHCRQWARRVQDCCRSFWRRFRKFPVVISVLDCWKFFTPNFHRVCRPIIQRIERSRKKVNRIVSFVMQATQFARGAFGEEYAAQVETVRQDIQAQQQ